jgi:acetyltransferase-like isoleucine patch superfamily enzyme
MSIASVVQQSQFTLTTHLLRLRYRYLAGLRLGRRVVFKGTPVIEISNGGQIIVEAGVTLNSSNRGYHLNMHSPVKLFVDRPGARIIIGAGSRLHGACLHAYSAITIGKRCLIAANTQIIDGSGHDLSFGAVEQRIFTGGDSRPIVLEDDVWVGANTLILPGVTIGKGSVIGAGSVVTKAIPPMVVAAGNPARIIKAAG